MRSRSRPPWARANSQLITAGRALPTCSRPVGLGAKRTFIGLSQAAGTSGSGRAAEGVGDGVAAVAAEGAAGDLHARASLAALVLRQLQHAPDAVHQVAVVAARDADVDALLALDEALQDVVEDRQSKRLNTRHSC